MLFLVKFEHNIIIPNIFVNNSNYKKYLLLISELIYSVILTG